MKTNKHNTWPHHLLSPQLTLFHPPQSGPRCGCPTLRFFFSLTAPQVVVSRGFTTISLDLNPFPNPPPPHSRPPPPPVSAKPFFRPTSPPNNPWCLGVPLPLPKVRFTPPHTHHVFTTQPSPVFALIYTPPCCFSKPLFFITPPTPPLFLLGGILGPQLFFVVVPAFAGHLTLAVGRAFTSPLTNSPPPTSIFFFVSRRSSLCLVRFLVGVDSFPPIFFESFDFGRFFF